MQVAKEGDLGHVVDELEVGPPDDGDKRLLGVRAVGYWPKPGTSSCSGVMAATLSRQRSSSAQNRSRATAAEGVKSTSCAGGCRRWPKVHSQGPAKLECRCPSRQAVQLIAKLTRRPGTPPAQGVVLDAADLIEAVEAEPGYTNASRTRACLAR
jgi:hypothetical protein